ncbi:MAG: pyruvate kinase alpha/beta domain-containing protein [PVC group bacterium]
MAKKTDKVEVLYFPAPGPSCTRVAVEAACRRAGELKIGEIVVATETGQTALEVASRFPGGKVIAVTYHSGAEKPFDEPLPPAARKKLTGKKAVIVTCGHALSGAERATAKVGGGAPLAVAAETLRMFGQGTKVCVESVLMAADAGALSGKDVIALGGSASGADTALVIAPAHQAAMFSLRIREVICKPRDFGRGR